MRSDGQVKPTSERGPVVSFVDVVGSLDPHRPTPLYQQLQLAVREAIVRRTLRPDEALPPERDLAEALAVSRITVRKAFDGLVAEGLLTRRQGAGTFVAARVEKSFSKLTSFSEDMAARGRKVSSSWLNRSEGAVTPEESLTLGLSPGAAVYRFHRIRYADDAPMALEYSTIPAACLPGLEAVGDSLYDALAEAGFRPNRALQRLRAVLFTPQQAELMGVVPPAAGLLIERRAFYNGQAVEVTQSYYRGDAYDFVAELNDGPA
jgi:GntR family transcriptional regulator